MPEDMVTTSKAASNGAEGLTQRLQKDPIVGMVIKIIAAIFGTAPGRTSAFLAGVVGMCAFLWAGPEGFAGFEQQMKEATETSKELRLQIGDMEKRVGGLEVVVQRLSDNYTSTGSALTRQETVLTALDAKMDQLSTDQAVQNERTTLILEQLREMRKAR